MTPAPPDITPRAALTAAVVLLFAAVALTAAFVVVWSWVERKK